MHQVLLNCLLLVLLPLPPCHQHGWWLQLHYCSPALAAEVIPRAPSIGACHGEGAKSHEGGAYCRHLHVLLLPGLNRDRPLSIQWWLFCFPGQLGSRAF